MLASLDYQIFLTRNSEYHLQSHVCVGVRDRRTGTWVNQHPALQRRLSATVRTAGALAVLQRPQLGESLEFDLDGAPLRTSPVLNIEQLKPWQTAAPINANGMDTAAPSRRRISTDSDVAR
jgi:hypothetical protein